MIDSINLNKKVFWNFQNGGEFLFDCCCNAVPLIDLKYAFNGRCSVVKSLHYIALLSVTLPLLYLYGKSVSSGQDVV